MNITTLRARARMVVLLFVPQRPRAEGKVSLCAQIARAACTPRCVSCRTTHIPQFSAAGVTFGYAAFTILSEGP